MTKQTKGVRTANWLKMAIEVHKLCITSQPFKASTIARDHGVSAGCIQTLTEYGCVTEVGTRKAAGRTCAWSSDRLPSYELIEELMEFETERKRIAGIAKDNEDAAKNNANAADISNTLDVVDPQQALAKVRHDELLSRLSKQDDKIHKLTNYALAIILDLNVDIEWVEKVKY